MAHLRALSSRVFKAHSKLRAYAPCLIETKELGAKDVEKVSSVMDVKVSSYDEGAFESRYHLLSNFPCVEDDEALVLFESSLSSRLFLL